MNKIQVDNDIPNIIHLDDTIEYELAPKNDFFNVNSIKLRIKKDTDLTISYNTTEKTKLDVFIYVEENVKWKLFETRKGKETKIQYKYYLEKNSETDTFQWNNIESMKELVIINLNGKNAKINHQLKTITTGLEKYDMTIYHNDSNTISDIQNRGVNIEKGNLIFNVSTFVLKGKQNCSANQNSRIVNESESICQINPNLFIDEFDVSANHAAHIGKCNEQEIFYLQSRGIPEKEAEKLWITGFLNQNMPKWMKEIITKNIEENWR